MGSLASNGLKGRLGLEWSQLKTPNSTIIKNNFSQQEFHVFSIPNLEVNNLKLYFSREFSSLPKTPKIICLEKHPDHLLILAEKSDKPITHWLNEVHCELSILLKLKDTISAANALKNKFGPFLITDKMINVSANDNLLVWYNERYESNLVQLPLFRQDKKGENQQIMVQNIIEIFRKSNAKHFSINLLIPENRTFVEFKNNVKSRIDQIESPYGSKNESQNSTKGQDSKKRSFTPNLQRSLRLENNKGLTNSSQSQKSGHKQRKSDHMPEIRISDDKQAKTTFLGKQKRYKSFLEDEAHKSRQMLLKATKSKQKPLSSLQEQSSQNYSSSNVSSVEINQKLISEGKSKSSRTFLMAKNQNNPENKKEQNLAIFKRKDYKFKTYNVDETNNNLISIKMSPPKLVSQKVIQNKQQTTSIKLIQASPLYKGCESFSSKKNFSLKSTTGTLKKTREFQENIRQLLQQHETIREESDETHKNSNNYSVESIKEELKEEMKASVSLSQDFNNLFSMADSVASGMEDSMREKEFERILFENS